MKDTTKRSIVRWIHLVLSIPTIGYIYSPFDQIPNYAPITRFVFLPAMALSGLWMWKGHLVRRLLKKSSAGIGDYLIQLSSLDPDFGAAPRGVCGRHLIALVCRGRTHRHRRHRQTSGKPASDIPAVHRRLCASGR
jgi:hypothetical protein